VGEPPRFLLAWGLPAFVVLTASFAGPAIRTTLWVVCLLWMGGACIHNAWRCGRTHCYFTGPFFLLMAGLTFFYGVGHLPLGNDGWTWLGLALVLGAALLGWLPEMIWGSHTLLQQGRGQAARGEECGKAKRRGA
jgi:hypothetical protein